MKKLKSTALKLPQRVNGLTKIVERCFPVLAILR
jgi:hypothetical protein